MKLIRAFAALAIATGAIAATSAIPSNAATPTKCTDRAEGGPSVAYGLTSDQRVVCFKVNRPSVSKTLLLGTQVLAPDSMLVSIDVRPASGALYGLGNAGGIYLLDPSTERPQLKARLSTALEGTNFGIDFNPTVDRLRIISDSGQNLRVNVDTGATTIDSALKNGANRAIGVSSAAYTNVDNDPSTPTTLFDIDGANDQLLMQAPPNDGVLVPVGKLGFRGSAVGAFDIWSEIKGGKAVSNRAFATLDGGGALFEIDLVTGTASFIGNANGPMVGIAFPA
jgi:Domain of unknown function (DUF4394)